MILKTLIMLALLLIGITFLALLFRRDCIKAKEEAAHEDEIDHFDFWIDD